MILDGWRVCIGDLLEIRANDMPRTVVASLVVFAVGYGFLWLLEHTLLPKASSMRRVHTFTPNKVVQIDNQWYEEWIETNMPDLSHKVAVITGGDSGIGFYAAAALAKKNCTVVLASRHLNEGNEAKQQILADHPSAKVEVFEMDNMNLLTVHGFAAQVLLKHDRLDFLVNNAGVMAKPLIKSKDGFDIQFQTNHLAHFLLTSLLWERLVSTPGQARVVNQSSMAHHFGSPIFDKNHMDYPTYRWGWFGINVLIKYIAFPAMGFRQIDQWLRYGVSKLCNILMMRELQRKIDENALSDKVIAVACHPGWASTPLHRDAAHAMKDWQEKSRDYGQSAADGSLPLLMSIVSPDVGNGDYMGPSGRGELGGPPKKVHVKGNGNDRSMAESLWQYSEECIGEKFKVGNP